MQIIQYSKYNIKTVDDMSEFKILILISGWADIKKTKNINTLNRFTVQWFRVPIPPAISQKIYRTGRERARKYVVPPTIYILMLFCRVCICYTGIGFWTRPKFARTKWASISPSVCGARIHPLCWLVGNLLFYIRVYRFICMDFYKM